MNNNHALKCFSQWNVPTCKSNFSHWLVPISESTEDRAVHTKPDTRPVNCWPPNFCPFFHRRSWLGPRHKKAFQKALFLRRLPCEQKHFFDSDVNPRDSILSNLHTESIKNSHTLSTVCIPQSTFPLYRTKYITTITTARVKLQTKLDSL